jgi:phosphoglycerate dehydrogenase-like enzyme
MSVTIWTNHELLPAARELLVAELVKTGDRLIQSAGSSRSVLAQSKSDPTLAEADIAYGQPDPDDVVRNPRLKWVALSTAGYTRYDRDDFRAAMKQRATRVTNASAVFANPCAEHVLAQMLALARNLPAQLRNQDGVREWRYQEDRFTNAALSGQSVLLLGFGAIGRRLAEFLRPFGGQVIAYRRTARGDEDVEVVNDAGLPAALVAADQVVNLLPDSPSTRGFMNAARFGQMKRGARFYNVGRGTTVDQPAIMAALESGHLAGAYLDVMDPEPLPPAHPLWSAPNCFITCHIAGGTVDQDEKLVRFFLENLQRFKAGEPLLDRII